MKRLLTVVRGSPLESRLEVRLVRLIRSHRLPPPANQFRVGRYRLDHAWPDRRVAVECDGFEHHGRRLVWKRDRRRIAELEAQGWRIIHVTWDDVTAHPLETIERIRGALQLAAA